VISARDWPSAELIETARLRLEPLRVEHSDEVAPALDDESLHEYIGGFPATSEQLRQRFARQVVGRSPDGNQGWLNWVARHRQDNDTVGTLQATLHVEGDQTVAAVAWVIAPSYQRQHYASEASTAMATWLRQQGVQVLWAYIHPAHEASIGVAIRLGLEATAVIVDGEVRWASPQGPG
jgi:RimJ/RimL family protein N-acetyltransferase